MDVLLGSLGPYRVEEVLRARDTESCAGGSVSTWFSHPCQTGQCIPWSSRLGLDVVLTSPTLRNLLL
jgi:hypothetical protein